VLDVAIKSHARYIVTFNLKDFPASQLKLCSIAAKSPDEFIKSLIELNSREVIKAFQTQVTNLKNPPMEQEEVLKTLEKNGLRTTVLELRKHLKLERS